MKPPPSIAQRFVSAVWRRIFFIRIVESIAVSAAVASVVGMILLPIYWMRGQPAAPMSMGILVAGVVVGVVLGVSRRPSRFAAAHEADTQLDLHDLLGTFLTIKPGSAEPWQRAIMAMADERCRALRPSSVIVNRIGLRGWAGVGILSLLLLTTALLTAEPAASTAATAQVGSDSAGKFSMGQPLQNSGISANNPSRPPGPGGVDLDSDRRFESLSRQDDSGSGHFSADWARGKTAGNDSSSGMGMATTPYKKSPADRALNQSEADARSQAGKVQDGDGPENSHLSLNGENNSRVAGSGHTTEVPAWEASDSRNVSGDDDGAADSGRDSDGDLVRDYFRRN